MPPESFKRKLVAILSADVAGYSRLMRDDEEATICTLTDYRRKMASLIQQYRGRVVDSPGDNLLAEFASVVDAVNCAVEIQRELAKRNTELAENRKMEFRIGLNLGDVVTEGERIYGDGVNIAARMEGLAEGGGICLSGTVYDAIENKIGLEYESLGEQEVKNISKPVRAYRVLWKVDFRLPAVKGMPDGKKDFALPDGPSIAVLPFVNMSGDPEQEYFSDGLTENIIAGLSVHPELLVIARNSTFAYKGKSVDIQEVGRKLGAQYVVEGSVQKTENRIRITVQLINANTGHHVWSDRYDRDLKDIFALQDEITIRIIAGVGTSLVSRKQLGQKGIPPSGSLEVFMKALKAVEYFQRFNKEDNVLARQELEEVITLDPEWPLLYVGVALTHINDLWFQSSESPLISFAQASRNIKKALSLDDENWAAHIALAGLYLLRKDHDKAIAAAERAIALNPNAADAYESLGSFLINSGRYEEGTKLIEKAMRLNPIPPTHYLQDLGYGYGLSGRYEDAIEMYDKALKRNSNNLFAQLGLACFYIDLGREEDARRHAGEVLKLDPTFSLDQLAGIHPLKDKAEVERIIDNLRKAGLK